MNAHRLNTMPAMLITEPRREHLARRARWLLVATVAWNAVEMVVAVAAGIVAGSLALVGFGLDSLIEVFAASVVLWQYRGHLPASRSQARALRTRTRSPIRSRLRKAERSTLAGAR